VATWQPIAAPTRANDGLEECFDGLLSLVVVVVVEGSVYKRLSKMVVNLKAYSIIH
jgi:hypothetical protein